MMPVVGKPVIQYVVEEAIKAGIKEIVLVTRSCKCVIEDHFDSHYELEHQLDLKNKTQILDSVSKITPCDVTTLSVRQPEVRGLDHAVHCAARIIINNEPFVVILPDVLVNNYQQDKIHLQQMVRAFDGHNAAPTQYIYLVGA